MASRAAARTNAVLLGLLLALLATAAAKPSQDAKDAKDAKDPAADGREAEQNAEFPEEDTDMLMEPNNFEPITVLRSQEQTFHPMTSSGFQPLVTPPQQQQQQQHQQQHQQQRQIAARMDDSNTQAAQNYYPPFFREAPPLGHSRPYFPTPELPAIPKYAVPLRDAKVDAVAGSPRSFDTALLGSGDFGVIRGGTFYPEEEMPYHPEENSDFSDYYADANNGHGRPANEGFIQKYTYPEEQFANFRDFADINTPADGAFSQFVVVYAAKNATRTNADQQRHPHPKNIFEQLEQLDREKALEAKKPRSSKSKSKLAKTKLEKKYKKDSSPKDMDYEPLLALS